MKNALPPLKHNYGLSESAKTSLLMTLSLSAFKNKRMILPSVYIFFLIAYMLSRK